VGFSNDYIEIMSQHFVFKSAIPLIFVLVSLMIWIGGIKIAMENPIQLGSCLNSLTW
jgi:hypothetical protein